MSTITPIRRALISVSDKTSLLDLGKALADKGVDIISTGGSAKALRDAGISVTDVSDVTGFPEIMDGRVKTLIPLFMAGFWGAEITKATNKLCKIMESQPLIWWW